MNKEVKYSLDENIYQILYNIIKEKTGDYDCHQRAPKRNSGGI